MDPILAGYFQKSMKAGKAWVLPSLENGWRSYPDLKGIRGIFESKTDGVTPTASEAVAAARIRAAFPRDELLLIPKQ